MSRTKEQILQSLPMLERRMQPKNRIAALESYQDAVVKAVFNIDHAEALTMKDCGNHFRELARERNLEDNTTIQTALKDMELIGREIAAIRSGAAGERAVEKSLRYVSREISSLSNVIVSKDKDKTELDQVVVTSNGVLILEVKNYRNDITIAESGQVYDCNRRRCSNKSLGERMNLKRYLLRNRLEKELGDRRIPIFLDSYIVFSDPSITVTDRYGLEKYCFNANLPGVIESFRSDVEYSAGEMASIVSAIERIAEQEEEFDIGMDFDSIRETFAEALILFETDIPCEEEPARDVSDRLHPNDNETIADLQCQLEQATSDLRKYKTVAVASTITLVGVLGIWIAGKCINKN